MPSTRSLLTTAALLSVVTSNFPVAVAEELSEEPAPVVTVYEGPTECSDEEKIKPNDYVSFQMQGQIDESSTAGIVGQSVLDSEEFNFEIGKGVSVKCWEIGLIGLCQGAKAKLLCGPELVDINEDGRDETHPMDATVLFDVTINAVMDPEGVKMQLPLNLAGAVDYFAEMDLDNDGHVTKDELIAFLGKYDEDGDGKLSEEEFRNGPEAPIFQRAEEFGEDIEIEE